MSNPHDLDDFPRPKPPSTKDRKGQGTEKGKEKGTLEKGPEERQDQSPIIAWIIIVGMGLLLINGFLYMVGFFGNLLGN